MYFNLKIRLQGIGRFLSSMVMPNIGVFIAWGLITTLFIPTGWIPNEQLSQLVEPMIKYLLPLTIAYTGGFLIAGQRGSIIALVAVMGVIVGTDIPMFLGAMIIAPISAYFIKYIDKYIGKHQIAGFEMLINNFSIGIFGAIFAVISFYLFGPTITFISTLLEKAVQTLVDYNILFLTSFIVEPAKILFLNNAINHGIFSPLGLKQAAETGKSIFFLIESNPGPGLGVLLAYTLFGTKTAKSTAPGAIIIHFFGGIHEIYFPYVLMNPLLIISVILGGMSGVFTFSIFHAGLVAPPSPGSIFSLLAMTPKNGFLATISGVLVAALVSFITASFILKLNKNDVDSLDESKKLINNEKMMIKKEKNLKHIKRIIVACDAGMGSSVMGATILKNLLEKNNIDIEVTNKAINQLNDNMSDIIITHEMLFGRAKKQAPNTKIIKIKNFIDKSSYQILIEELKK